MFENSDAVSFATNGTATYHYPNRDHRTIGPFGSGATLKTDGEKIVGRVEAPAFRIGGVYRDKAGKVILLKDPAEYGFRWPADEALAVRVTGAIQEGYGSRCLSDGTCRVSDEEKYLLLPGELVQRDGQWVAMEEAKPASMTPTLDALEAESIGDDYDEGDCWRDTAMLSRDARQPTARERSVMARINLAKALTAEWEAAKKQPALPHPYPFARNFQG